jgi:hypothetical protein
MLSSQEVLIDFFCTKLKILNCFSASRYFRCVPYRSDFTFLNLDIVSVSELTTKRLTSTLNDIIHYFYVEKVKKILYECGMPLE